MTTDAQLWALGPSQELLCEQCAPDVADADLFDASNFDGDERCAKCGKAGARCGWRMLCRTIDGDGYAECRREPGHDGKHFPGPDIVFIDDLNQLEAAIRERNGKGPFDA